MDCYLYLFSYRQSFNIYFAKSKLKKGNIVVSVGKLELEQKRVDLGIKQ